MTTYVALLRAVNVGGRNRVAMPAFRTALESLGYADVRTYVQSGNAVFSGPRKSTATTATAIAKQLKKELGLDLDVVVRTGPELRDAINRNPFPGKETNHKALHIGFLQSKPTKAKVDALVPPKSETGQFRIDGREIYLYRAEGIGTSKLTPDFFARLGVPSTMRNWKTVTTLAEMAGA